MIPLNANVNVDNSDLVNYPSGRIKNNTGSGNGTPVDRSVYGDIHSTISRLMRAYGIVPNGFPDNETTGYQIIESLIALASKNDYVLGLTTNSVVLSVPVKLNSMVLGESLVCKSGIDLSAETTIKGSDNVVFSFSKFGDFKTGEYVRLVRTSGGIDLIRLGDSVSINAMVSDLFFLKKASQAQEDSGALDTVATTPLVNKTAFTKRVNGIDSPIYLASASKNGLMSIAHFNQLNIANKTRNVGSIYPVDVNGGTVGATYSVGGDIISATITAANSDVSVIRIVLRNTMTDNNYFVRISLESQGADTVYDRNLLSPIFKVDSENSFYLVIREVEPRGVQNLKIHLEAVKI